MPHNYRIVLLSCILIAGFAFRFVAAKNCCVVWDERNNIFPPAREISFDLQKPHFPLVDKRPEGVKEGTCPMAGKYLVKAGWMLFGDSLLGARLPFLIIDTVAIWVVYCLVSSVLGFQVALLSAAFLSLSQFCITGSRFADPSGAIMRLMFFLSLYLFWVTLQTSKKRLFLLNGALIGLGFWSKEHMVFLIPIFIIFILMCREYKPWLRDRYLWASFIIAFAIMLPLIILNLDPEAVRFRYIINQARIGFSLNATALYLGELILLAIAPFPDLFDFVAGSMANELTMENFILGSLVLVSVGLAFREKGRFLRLMLVAFLFNFLVFSFLRQNDIIQSFWSLGAVDWSSLNFIPGIILASWILVLFITKHKKTGTLFLAGLLTMMAVRAWDIARYPLNADYPRRHYLLETEYFIHEAQDLVRLGDHGWAKDMLGKLYEVSGSSRACLMLAEIAYAEGDCETGSRWLKKISSNNGEDPEVLNLSEQGCVQGVPNSEILLKYQKR